MNFVEIAMLISSCVLVMVMIVIIMLITLGIAAFTDLVFDTKLLKRVKDWMFYYEESN